MFSAPLQEASVILKMKPLFIHVVFFSAVIAEIRPNFNYETRQLRANDFRDAEVTFGNISTAPKVYQGPECKIQSGDSEWPSESLWARFNTSVNGTLLKPHPVALACYPQTDYYSKDTCSYLVNNASSTRFFLDDPVNSLTTWAQGGSCLQMLDTTGRTCNQQGTPTYVVNASSVAHIQAAVNFARNHNLRLVIKGTGHDFHAKSSGSGSLSVWTHFLKSMTYLCRSSLRDYTGPVVRIGAGVEAWEAYNFMLAKNITFAAPLEASVGHGGGWTLGGGHGPLTSLCGLGADQVLSINVVTADGRFLTADGTQNQDLFYALRGGGGGTFGIVTSFIVRAWDKPTFIGGLTYYFTTGPNAANIAMPSDRGYPATPAVYISDPEIFWKAFSTYLNFTTKIVDAGGFGFGDPSPQGKDTYLFASTIAIPNLSAEDTISFAKPLFESYASLGINITTTPQTASVPYAKPGNGITTVGFPGAIDRIFISRLLPRTLWTEASAGNSTRLDLVAKAIRKSVETGIYKVNTRAYAPTTKAAGEWNDQYTPAVNPAMRKMVIHCTTFTNDVVTLQSKKELLETHKRLSASGVADLRKLTPESGAYFNEADRLEPDWQKSFWSTVGYSRLLGIKKKYDPWALFWASNTVGSEDWELRPGLGEGVMPTQDGRVCRAKRGVVGREG
ncbi:6-hydroxy-D-nicotine oxidase [Rhypophila decipiens]|uniref:6-hydroxy-D-nicotine oxidase n=1 Tax=Rhypophila decipiens TaxID=261697 RepID=A0AAN6Y5K6_9PEZI|nr:6-hydroxy-D-nicotine oxidase [Rhypophila decipiens]